MTGVILAHIRAIRSGHSARARVEAVDAQGLEYKFEANADEVRGSVGDVLAVMFVYAALRAITPWSMRTTALLAVAIGFAVEASQYVHLAERLGFAKGSVMYVLLGNTFSVMDLFMYGIGGALAWALDRRFG